MNGTSEIRRSEVEVLAKESNGLTTGGGSSQGVIRRTAQNWFVEPDNVDGVIK